MSYESKPLPPRTFGPPPGARYSLFWPVLVFFVGFGAYTFSQIWDLEDQIDSVNGAIDKMTPKIERAGYEKNKFYTLAKDILRLAPQDAMAQQIATELNLDKLRQTDPLLSDNPSRTNNTANAVPPAPAPGSTNAASTNTAPLTLLPTGQ